MVELVQAEQEAHLEAVRSLMRGFVDWHLERHSDSVSLIRTYFDPVTFEAELADLPGKFRPPRGRLLLAIEDGEALGCIALHDLGDGVCEMKRLFVAPGHHGRGLGQLLAQRVIEEAVASGYHTMRLDTGPKQAEAQGPCQQGVLADTGEQRLGVRRRQSPAGGKQGRGQRPGGGVAGQSGLISHAGSVGVPR